MPDIFSVFMISMLIFGSAWAFNCAWRYQDAAPSTKVVLTIFGYIFLFVANLSAAIVLLRLFVFK